MMIMEALLRREYGDNVEEATSRHKKFKIYLQLLRRIEHTNIVKSTRNKTSSQFSDEKFDVLL